MAAMVGATVTAMEGVTVIAMAMAAMVGVMVTGMEGPTAM